jgi:dTDP-4-dehydrorhamnose reductase
LTSILILGATGMLGSHLTKHFQDRCETLTGVDATHWPEFELELSKTTAPFIVNAIGFVKQRTHQGTIATQIEINALFPHRLAHYCKQTGRQLIHFSTDCVFSGRTGQYSETDFVDPVDVYGQTKALGEVISDHAITLRTSFIGLQTDRKDSLIEWFLAQKGPILGYKKAIYSGLTIYELARIVDLIVSQRARRHGLYHVSAAPISKYELLSMLCKKLSLDVTISADETFVCDRSMKSERFQTDFNYSPPTWDDMLSELAHEIKKRNDYV